MELAALTDYPSCVPDKATVGSYFVFGLPLYEEDDVEMPSPVYAGESCNIRGGMKGRTDNHMASCYRAHDPDKRLYKLLDHDDSPMQPYVLAMCKETVVDKAWTRFRELIIRHLLGTNDDIVANKDFRKLEAYAVLKFTQSVVPTNRTNVLREGLDIIIDDPQELEIHRQTLEELQNEDHTCFRCGADDSCCWHRDLINRLEAICNQCFEFHRRYGRYPTTEDTAALRINAKRLTALAEARAGYECPGYCENPHCGTTMTPDGYWDFNQTHKLWFCHVCRRHSARHDGELRVPMPNAAAKKEHPPPGWCENENCGTTVEGTDQWNFSGTLGLWFCKKCIHWVKKYGTVRPQDDKVTTRPYHDHPCPNICENEHCRATTSTSTSKWRYNKDLRCWLCSRCVQYLTRTGNLPTKPLEVHVRAKKVRAKK